MRKSGTKVLAGAGIFVGIIALIILINTLWYNVD